MPLPLHRLSPRNRLIALRGASDFGGISPLLFQLLPGHHHGDECPSWRGGILPVFESILRHPEARKALLGIQRYTHGREGEKHRDAKSCRRGEERASQTHMTGENKLHRINKQTIIGIVSRCSSMQNHVLLSIDAGGEAAVKHQTDTSGHKEPNDKMIIECWRHLLQEQARRSVSTPMRAQWSSALGDRRTRPLPRFPTALGAERPDQRPQQTKFVDNKETRKCFTPISF